MAVASQMVQACHVATEWGIDRGVTYAIENPIEWDKTMVVVTVPSLGYLDLWERKLDLKSLEYSVFHEPDMGNTLTAIACLTDSNIFDSLPLWLCT